jgi:two-component system invasion response regulator UvrY
MHATKRVLIVDDYYIVRAALKSVMEGLSYDIAVTEVTSYSDMLEVLSQDFDLIILDIVEPEASCRHIIERIKQTYPGAAILIFSSASEHLYATFYLKAGANGFLSKNAQKQDIENAISLVLDAGTYVSTSVRNNMLNQLNTNRAKRENPLKELSSREVEVMDLLIEGLWLKEIANKLRVTESSVSTYKSRIFTKLHVTNIIELYRKVKLYKGID